jgi:DMSO/TMAO reductase YedYZ molybdopterin-dependent catalytic subunit
MNGLNLFISKKHISLLVGLLFFILSLSGCIEEDFILDDVEVRDYQGEKLSSIYDFRENSIKGPQYIDRNTFILKITGLVNKTINFTYNETINNFQNYKKVITLHCVEGWSVKILWDGILVEDLIAKSDPLDDVNTIIFHAYDGYTTSLPLDYIIDNKILLAFNMNNVTLPPERGWPFQLVAESKWGYKWIKWVTEIELSNNPNYKGYWERRGY